jgi:DNA-binding NtrC family response regulator
MGRDPKKLAPDAIAALRGYAWPGNVRELEHAMERALVLSQGTSIHAADLPFEVAAPRDVVARGEPTEPTEPGARLERAEPPDSASPGAETFLAGGPLPASLANMPFAEAKKLAMTLFEDAYVAEMLRRADGNLSEAARKAGVDRSNFKRIARKTKT